jgi:adenosylcobyric acid synthase
MRMHLSCWSATSSEAALFEDGARIIEKRAGIPVLGVIPYVENLNLPEEDAACLDGPATIARHDDDIDIVVVRLPHIANFDDFDPLATEEGVHVRYVSSPRMLGSPAAVILPGTRSTIGDLAWLRSTGLADAILSLAHHGTSVIGICGGYQMLGRSLDDPDHVESSAARADGLALLGHRTTFVREKTTRQVQGRVVSAAGWLHTICEGSLHGYEIHMGVTHDNAAWLNLARRGDEHAVVPDGDMSPDGHIWGCYVHGLFANENIRHAWLASLGWHQTDGVRGPGDRTREFDRLADAILCALDMHRLERIVEEQ